MKYTTKTKNNLYEVLFNNFNMLYPNEEDDNCLFEQAKRYL